MYRLKLTLDRIQIWVCQPSRAPFDKGLKNGYLDWLTVTHVAWLVPRISTQNKLAWSGQNGDGSRERGLPTRQTQPMGDKRDVDKKKTRLGQRVEKRRVQYNNNLNLFNMVNFIIDQRSL